jgi:hypothetical protein
VPVLTQVVVLLTSHRLVAGGKRVDGAAVAAYPMDAVLPLVVRMLVKVPVVLRKSTSPEHRDATLIGSGGDASEPELVDQRLAIAQVWETQFFVTCTNTRSPA